jgi:mRNA interferase MazF
MTRGELYRVFQPLGDPKRFRTFVIVSRQILIESRFSAVVCAPIFTEAEGLSTQIPVGPDEGLKHPSWIMCDNLISLPKADLTYYIGALSAPKISALDRALKIALSLS